MSSKRYGGGATILSPAEEQEIVITCQVLAKMGFPLTKDYVAVVVRVQAEGRNCLFSGDGLPGRSWWRDPIMVAQASAMEATAFVKVASTVC